ncbi:hypothetical protein Lbys_0258 [Leadbetterella byssophila DSM 17132]|uniref:Lipoprotein n=1 Tax=Leadbetterella byssophila (strain DSM 17132 / JCM 16389 / KACC 11308 / NBRC 106382 / 4M15) TaxID=649349 RepID=E4RUP8_LEAB4|nr:hypothetical protein [Leadbetterella byssophila]ADQ16049.1 hypothetical protein Lbys_0258 [Leadbetterella byssophila DSM 17132]
MKSAYLMALLLAILITSCAETENPFVPEEPKPENPVQIVDEPDPVDFQVTETKEPYFTIADKGFEALLIVLNIDTDNQINGKVSQADVLNVKDLRHNLNGSPNLKAEFIKQKYGAMPTIKDFDDIRHFKNLQNLGVHGGKTIDLSLNANLEKIEWTGGLGFETLNLTNLDKLKIVQCYAPMMPHASGDPGEVQLKNNTSLEVFEYYGHANSIDLSQAPNLKILIFNSWSYQDSVVNLLNTTHLDKVHIGITNRKGVKVLVSPQTMEKIKTNPSNFHIPETAIWTVRG